MAIPWTEQFADRTRSIKSSTIRELLKVTQRPEIISFAGGLPAPELFPTERFQEACSKVLTKNSGAALQYGATEGYTPLRQLIAEKLADAGIRATVENVVITAGSQQALDLIGKLLIDNEDRVLVEAPTYLGALQAFNVYGARYISVPIDDDGLRTDLVEAVVKSQPKFMYILPNFQNPGGVTLTEGRRHELVMLSDRYLVPIVEDDPYGALRYEGEALPSLLSIDQQNHRRDENPFANVIQLGTFSKTLAPGLRLGWIVAAPEVISKLVQLKQGADLHTSTFSQVVAFEVARDGFLEEHIEHIRTVYRERRDVMLDALQEFFPAEVGWTRPEGGLFLWVTLPEGINSQRLFEMALSENVAFVPGDPFFANADNGRHLRLNFSNADPAHIREGIRRLARAVRSAMESSVPVVA
jgi:2-aminoadipate transaminase